jgi:hypothetical protein
MSSSFRSRAIFLAGMAAAFALTTEPAPMWEGTEGALSEIAKATVLVGLLAATGGALLSGLAVFLVLLAVVGVQRRD